jgi:hypothetical protein
MNEERTRDLSGRSFEERVFARLDSLDARFDGMDARFDRVETRLDSLDLRVQALESRAVDNKPIWERALAEILEVKKGVEDLNRKIDILNQVRADQRLLHKHMDALESGSSIASHIF